MNAVPIGVHVRAPQAAPRRRADAVAGPAGVAHFLRDTSLHRALDVVGDWWTQLILREAFLRVRNFDEFQLQLAIPRQTLARRLKALVENDILDTARGGYRLTPRGLALFPWALMVWRWGMLWSGNAGPRHPSTLMHHDCGQSMTPVFACGACRRQVTLRDITYRALPQARLASAERAVGAVARRWTGEKFVLDAQQASQHVAFITADRWTHLILSAAFLGCRTFDRFEREIGISANILSRRLALLVHAGFLTKVRSPQDARRFDYRLTPRSRDVFPVNIALIQWADAQLRSRRGPPLQRYHHACGQAFHATVICSRCRGELLPRSVSFTLNPAASDAATTQVTAMQGA